ncbi:hypothetical protein [Streptomyces sp. WG5]|uniref:hypothetical protein n=1 Tax=Streptomyces sp. WG5 TaxID=3417648 RepID=UPI003CF65312
MYLVHVRLCGPPGRPLPPDAHTLVLSHAQDDDGLEHVCLHPHARPDPVLGLYLIADTLDTAETKAVALCNRALLGTPELDAWSVRSAAAPLITPFYEALFDAPPVPPTAVAENGQDPLGPPRTSSGPSGGATE